jgi:integrase/recombinase XerC
MVSLPSSTALMPYLGHGEEGATAWLHLAPSDRRRTAMGAAHEHDAATLWSLTEAWLRTFSHANTRVAPSTVRGYRTGVHLLLAAWREQDLLRPAPEAGIAYVRQLERAGRAASTIQARVAAGRGLYAALRWCRATGVAPFADCRVPVDPTPPWDKRLPYGDDEIAALLQVAAPVDQVLVLLGAHAGLRAQECASLRWADVHLARRDLIVRLGKGGRQWIVALSATLRQALATLPRREDGYVLPYRTAASAWRHMQELCQKADVVPKGVHALRHSAGTRLYAETHDLTRLCLRPTRYSV